MKTIGYIIPAIVLAFTALMAPGRAIAQVAQPTEESKKFPVGSAEERRARMAKRAKSRAYTKKFDLSGLPHYVPQEKPTGKLRVWGSNYVGDAPLGGWWKEAFEKFQPGIKIEYNLPTGAIATPSIYFDLADIGINHDPVFYDYLSHQRIKGFEPTGFSVFTGSYNVIGWTNNLVIVVNKDNPITKISMKQLDGIFGSLRDGGWIGTTWHPEFSRGAEGNIRKWGQLGLTGKWADMPINVYGYSLRYETALFFSDKVLQSSDKWNEALHAYGNFRKPDGTIYLEADQIVDQLRKHPNGIGYARYHDGFPSDIKVLAIAQTEKGPYVEYNIDTVQNRSYPLWADQSFWVSLKPGTKMDPKVKEFLRFVLSQEGQELVQQDGKYLPLTAEAVREELKKLE